MTFFVSPLVPKVVVLPKHTPLLIHFGEEASKPTDHPSKSSASKPRQGKKSLSSSEKRIQQIKLNLETFIKDKPGYDIFDTIRGTQGTPFYRFCFEEIKLALSRFIEASEAFIKAQRETNPWILPEADERRFIRVKPHQTHDFSKPTDGYTFENWRKAKLAQIYRVEDHRVTSMDDTMLPGALFYTRHYLATFPHTPSDQLPQNEFLPKMDYCPALFIHTQISSHKNKTKATAIQVKFLYAPHAYWTLFKNVENQFAKMQAQSKTLLPAHQVANVVANYTQRFQARLHHPVDIFQLAAAKVYNQMWHEEDDFCRQSLEEYDAARTRFYTENRGEWVSGLGTISNPFTRPKQGPEHILSQLGRKNLVETWFTLQNIWDDLLKLNATDLAMLDDSIITMFPPVTLLNHKSSYRKVAKKA